MLKASSESERFNIIAQSGTAPQKVWMDKPKITVRGNGSRPPNLVALQNRAKKKMITQRIMQELMPIALRKGEFERYYSYQNAFGCQCQIYTANGRMYGIYCKTRFCEICLGNRRGEKSSKYLPVIRLWPCQQFLTLTLKSVPGDQLHERVNEMIGAFETIREKLKKRHQRGKGMKIMGVRSLESNFNPTYRTYNPHFHLILPDLPTAITLQTEWINYWGDVRICEPEAQKNKTINNISWQLRETIKYGTKFLTKERIDWKTGEVIPKLICVAAIDNIFSAMKNHRLFDRFGFDLPKPEKQEAGKFTSLTEFREWNYTYENFDWVDEVNRERISRFTPPPKLIIDLETNINRDLE
jgi:hypothetical protein